MYITIWLNRESYSVGMGFKLMQRKLNELNSCHIHFITFYILCFLLLNFKSNISSHIYFQYEYLND